MVVTRVLRSSGCASCRLLLLRGFTSVAGPSLRIPHTSSQYQSHPVPKQSRFYSSQETDTRQENDVIENEEDLVDEELEELEAHEEAGESTEVAAVPWYLQVQSPQREPKPLSERQKIPELPESPPPILEPLLQQISIDLGLDDLNLLDLRKLDPPPALGANLLMLIGTARSERHLHVSADRLCRWLRSTYKLRPDADGLLGRNELKLKLRRKAKRAKLMGSAAVENGDDGVRTGWVCVDVGVVESAEGEVEEVAEPQEFVGFGRKTDGVRIVVQMLTEEKRQEIELERLWEGILRRSGQKDLESGEESTIEPPISEEILPESSSVSSKQGPSSGPTIMGTRGYHTFARKLPRFEITKYRRNFSSAPVQQYVEQALRDSDPVMAHDSTDQAFQEAPSTPNGDIADTLVGIISAGKFKEALETMQAYTAQNPDLPDNEWRPFMLEQLLSRLQSVPKEEALQYLGHGASDYSSTPFLTCFYNCLSGYSTPSEVDSRIWLHCFAQALGHEGYSRSGLMQLFAELKICGAEISEKSFMHLLRGVVQTTEGESHFHGPPKAALEALMDILQTMHARGFPILHENILVELQALVSPAPNPATPPHEIYTDPVDTCDLPSLPMSSVQQRLHQLIIQIDLPCFEEPSRIRLLDLYASQGHWREFWDVWRMAPRHCTPQSPIMYALMFSRVAQAANQKACMNVLRTWVPDMESEEPPVALEGHLAEAVRACLKVADPFLPERAAKNPDGAGEVIPLWVKAGGLESGE